MDVIIALGSNLGSRAKQIEAALAAISKEVGPLRACSEVIETEPLLHPTNYVAQPPYLNAVALFDSISRTDSTCRAEQIMTVLLNIEERLGRLRTVADKRWSPRVIDLDLIAVGDSVVDLPLLTLPHPEMHKRSFVLKPMMEVAPNWIHPILKKSTGELLNELIAG